MHLFSTSTYSGQLDTPQLVFFGLPLGCNMWYQLPFSSTYFEAVPNDLRWSEPPTGVTRHSMSHESACHFRKPAMGKLATQKTAQWPRVWQIAIHSSRYTIVSSPPLLWHLRRMQIMSQDVWLCCYNDSTCLSGTWLKWKKTKTKLSQVGTRGKGLLSDYSSEPELWSAVAWVATFRPLRLPPPTLHFHMLFHKAVSRCGLWCCACSLLSIVTLWL